MSLLHTRCDAEIRFLREALSKERERNDELTKILATMADPLAQARVVDAKRRAEQPVSQDKDPMPGRKLGPAALRASQRHAQRPDPAKWLTPPPADPNQPPAYNRVEAQFVRPD